MSFTSIKKWFSKSVTNFKKNTTKIVSKSQPPKLVRKAFLNFSLPLTLVVIGLILAFQNYLPGTFLSGWDTLHPEFDYKLNLARTLSGVFRTEQGLGAVASHAHMVEVTRILMLWIYDIFLPQSMLRYAYFFTCLVLGPLGMFYFLQKVFFKRQLPSFLGALFYLLNVGTYQVFVVPFEMFAALYATLPWFFLTFDALLRKVDRKNVALFSIVTLLASQAAYASSLWYLFFATVILYFTPFVLLKLGVDGIVKRFFIAISLIFIINSYWMLPNIYFATHDAQFVTDANINKLFSEEAFLKNKEFGNVADILALKSFYFDWGIYDFSSQKFEQITASFKDHLSNPLNANLTFIYASIFIFGFLLAFKRYRALSISFVSVVVFSSIFLFNDNPPVSFVFNYLQENIPLFKEALRFPHNKIHNVFIFFVSIFFAVGIDFFIINLKKLSKTSLASLILTLLISTSLVYYMLPAFKGELINRQMKSSIPAEYFQMFDYLSNEGDGRIASLPVHSPWGWVYNKWDNANFQGAGFLYFGIKQSLLDRDFDRWNPLNEQFYLEISNAVYSENKELLSQVLEKYDVSFLLLDKSIVTPGSDANSMYLNQIQQMLSEIENDTNILISKKDFGNYLTVYKLENDVPFPLSSVNKVTFTKSYMNNYHSDTLFNSYGNYVEIDNRSDLTPLSFINNESKVDKNLFKIENDYFTLKTPNNSRTSFATSELPNKINSRVVGSRNSDGLLLLDIYPSFAKVDDVEIVSPIHNNILLEDASVLAVNENIIYLDKVNDVPTILDTVPLSPSSNSVATFDRSIETALSYYVPSIPMTFSYCGNDISANIQSVITENSVTIDGLLTNDYCIAIPAHIFATHTPTSLARITFEYLSDNAIGACLKKYDEDKCYYNIPVKNIGQYKSLEFGSTDSTVTGSKLEIKIGKSKNSNVELNNLNIEMYPSINEVAIDNNYFQNEAPDSFSWISFPYSQDSSTHFEAISTSDNESECREKGDSTGRKFAKNESSYYEYHAIRGNYCDHIEFASLSHAQSYFVVVKSQNIEGLPLTLCITNYTSRKCDVFSKLGNYQNPDTDIFFLPSKDIDGLGYDVNVENRSVEKSISRNRLYSVQFIPVQSSLINKIHSGTAIDNFYTGGIINTKIYGSSIIAETDGKPSLLKLSYSYHKGFAAYKITCESELECILSSMIAPFAGKELTHGKGLSWNNVWEYIPSGSEREKVVIMFLPQYLQYVGVGLIGFPIFYLLLPSLLYLIRPFLILDEFFNNKTEYYKKRIKIITKRNVGSLIEPV